MKVFVVTKSSDIPTTPVDGKPTCVYWKIQGLAQAIRLSLAATGVEFVDVRIDAGDPKPGDDSLYKKAWFDVKPSMPLAFPNLPYFLDGEDVKLTQSNTILRYIGRKYDMMGPKEHETDLLLDQLSDLDGALTGLSYRSGPDAVLDWYKEKAATELARFKPLLKEDFLSGAKPSVADMKFYVWLYKLTVVQEKLGTADTASILSDWVHDYMKRIEALPGVAEYMASPHHIKSPLNNPHAKWQG